MRGVFRNGQPLVDIEVSGVKGLRKRMTALVDSGFNGHLQIPFVEALPLGLVLSGTARNLLADGSSVQHLVCEGDVGIGGSFCKVAIDIVPAEIVLIGTALLAKMKKKFTLDCLSGSVEIS
jgi:predicted aspartyl protease